MKPNVSSPSDRITTDLSQASALQSTLSKSSSNETERMGNLNISSYEDQSLASTNALVSTFDMNCLLEFPPLAVTKKKPQHTVDTNSSMPRSSPNKKDENSASQAKKAMPSVLAIDTGLLGVSLAGLPKETDTTQGKPLWGPLGLSRNGFHQAPKNKFYGERVEVRHKSSTSLRAGKNDMSQTVTHQQNSGLDKAIALKKGLTRQHIHRYDLRIKVKLAKSEDEEVVVLQQALQKFCNIALQADPSTIIPPYFELDHNEKMIPDLSSKFKVGELDSIPSIKRYYSRLPNRSNQGDAYCSLILMQNITFYKFMDKARLLLINLNFRIFPRRVIMKKHQKWGGSFTQQDNRMRKEYQN
jgi:hypothetical protein